jgi:isoleucyl-tRNA synthetase
MPWRAESRRQAKVEAKKLRAVDARRAGGAHLLPPAACGRGYTFDVPLIDGDHVTDDAGTGFVHTAPGHGREDFEAWMDHAPGDLKARGIDTAIPFTVDDGGFYTKDAPGFRGRGSVIDDKGKKGDANKRVIAALIEPTSCSRAAA